MTNLETQHTKRNQSGIHYCFFLSMPQNQAAIEGAQFINLKTNRNNGNPWKDDLVCDLLTKKCI